MPYLNIDDGMDEHPKVEVLSDAAFRDLFRAICEWSRTGQTKHADVAQLIKDKSVRRAPSWWMPEAIRPRLRHRPKIKGEMRALVYTRDGHACRYCHAKESLTLDHIVPWSLGGPDDASNLQTLCQSCNSSKGART